jgi:uncharacterized protein
VNRIKQVFGVSRVLLPVIHPIGHDTALESIRVVRAAGVRGVFLIDQGMGEREVLALVREARAMFPGLWLGVNLLGRRPADALAVALAACDGRIDGIWSDNAGIDERAAAHPEAEEFVAARQRLGWQGLYFGGVAFKYQREVPVSELERSAALATRYMDVVCTSGPGTGHAADPEKIRSMHAGLGNGSLAVASGITAENVRLYLPYVHAFLVGTGIEARLGVIDPQKLSALLQAMT